MKAEKSRSIALKYREASHIKPTPVGEGLRFIRNTIEESANRGCLRVVITQSEWNKIYCNVPDPDQMRKIMMELKEEGYKAELGHWPNLEVSWD